MISVLDRSSIVQGFKIIKFKKKEIMISDLDSSSIVQCFKIIKFKINLKKSNYNFCFGYFKYSSKF
jgi:hypothetical protein